MTILAALLVALGQDSVSMPLGGKAVPYPARTRAEVDAFYTAALKAGGTDNGAPGIVVETEPGAVRAKAYDLVLNGSEIGGGSIRIHDSNLQRRIFSLLNISDEEARLRFGFFLEALEYGTPPHGGIAFGLDRILAILCGESSIREVIAFPKTAQAIDLMAGAPSPVDAKQLRELRIKST